MFFCLRNTLELDAARPVSDMAAFFGYQPAPSAALTLTLAREHGCISACLQGAEQSFTASEPCSEAAASGDITRCVKLVVLKVFAELTGLQPKLPWGILTGVRPTKLAHKLLDGGVEAAALPEYLSENYLLPMSQGRLLTDIALKQNHILSDSTRLTDTGIYIGVPYCPSRCSYCSFPAGIVPQDEESQQNFVNMIEQDLQNVVQLIGMHSLRVKSLYIGGGTPTSLSDKVFARLLQAVERRLLQSNCEGLRHLREFTVEAGRPDTITQEKLQVLARHGVGRVSINPQSMDDRVLALCGRRHKAAQIPEGFRMARQAGFSSINMDLIAGLPGDTPAGFRGSLEAVAALGPENITIHTLALKKGADLYQHPENLPNTEDVAEMVRFSQEFLRQQGYQPYYLYRQKYMSGNFENVGWCKPGKACLYNIYMMEELHSIVALGAGATSKANFPGGRLERFANPKFPQQYMERLGHVIEEKQRLIQLLRQGKE